MPSHVVASLQQQLAAAPAAPEAAAVAAAGGGGVQGAGAAAATAPDIPDCQVPAVRAALRLARYSLSRCGAVLGLMLRLASVPESFEMARATGLTLDQVCVCVGGGGLRL